jgi:phosphatidylinositol phospholipase C delta
VAEVPDEIKALFDLYSENGIMTADHIHRFLIEVQKQEEATFEEAQSIVESLKHLSLFHRKGLHLEAFFKYLFGDTNPPLDLKLGVIFLSFFYPSLLWLNFDSSMTFANRVFLSG